MMNLFEMAVRNKFRWQFKGVLSIEDLWDLKVEELDAIYKKLNAQKSVESEKSLLATPSKDDEELNNKIRIVEYVVAEKLAEAAKKVRAAEKKAERDRLLEAINARESEEFAAKSKDELLDMLAKLDEE